MAGGRQAASIAGAAVVLTGIGLLGYSVRSKLYQAAATESEWESRQLALTIRDEIHLKAREIEARVAAAASLNPIRALVSNPVDRATLVDAVETEEWWNPFREEFPVQFLSIHGEKLELSDQKGLDFDSLLELARRKSPASQVVAANQKAFFAAATLVEVPTPSRRSQSFLVLAKPLPPNDLVLSPNFSGAFLLATDKTPLLGGGSPVQLQALQQVVGKDPSTSIVSADASSSASAVELSPNLFLWVRTDNSARSAEVSRVARSILVPLWAVAAGLVAGCLYLGFRRRGARNPSSPPLDVQANPLVSPYRERMVAEAQPAPDLLANVVSAEDDAANSAVLSAVPSGVADSNQFGRYRLLDALGEGSTMRADLGVLYGAEGFSRLFVIKRLRAELARQPSAVAEFVERARLGSSLVHSNIVPIYDFGKVNDEYFIAQEHILGRDLQILLQRLAQNDRKLLPPALVFYMALEVLKALEYAHAHRNSPHEAAGVVHGNISPRKILISPMGEVKILDFGIPHAKAKASTVHLQATSFLSPEQARGEMIDARTDLFSVGMTMLWCLTGRTPYAARPAPELLERVRAGPGREGREMIAALGAPTMHVLQRAVEASPAKRFQTAEEFAHAIPPWELSRGTYRLHSLMQRLFDDDLRKEQARYADWRSQLEKPSAPESQPGADNPVRQMGRLR